MASQNDDALPPIIWFDRFALVKKKHDKDVVELKIRFADFRYHKIRTFFNRKRHAKGNVKFSRFLHDAFMQNSLPDFVCQLVHFWKQLELYDT